MNGEPSNNPTHNTPPPTQPTTATAHAKPHQQQHTMPHRQHAMPHQQHTMPHQQQHHHKPMNPAPHMAKHIPGVHPKTPFFLKPYAPFWMIAGVGVCYAAYRYYPMISRPRSQTLHLTNSILESTQTQMDEIREQNKVLQERLRQNQHRFEDKKDSGRL